jgi:hypothetical protein
MARIEWVELRLKNWALWAARGDSGGLGFKKQSALAERVDNDRYREAPLPVDDVDAGVTNDGVEAFKLPRPHLYHTLQWFYPKGLGIKGTALKLGCAESTVHARLGEADRALAQWFTERTERQKASQSAYLQQVQAVRATQDAPVVVTRRSFSEEYFANRD